MGFDGFFDFDGDGLASTMEYAAGFALTASIIDDVEREERAENLRGELLFSGLDEFELSLMDDSERFEALESAGLDPGDYDSFEW